MSSVVSAGRDSNISLHCWTDSTVVLSWLNEHASRWKTFVANRVSDIQTRLPTATWRHVPSRHNPADIASRGISSSELVNHALWWNGPQWLKLEPSEWPRNPLITVTDDELVRKLPTTHTAHVTTEGWDLPTKISTWPRLVRVTAYVLRFVRLCRFRSTDKLTFTTEIQNARQYWVQAAQQSGFHEEIRELNHSRSVPPRSRLSKLTPFLDSSGTLRVGGRLCNSALSYDERHPIILPPHRISDLLVRHTHLRCLHGGLQMTLRVLRQQFWLLGARNIVRAHINRCIQCVRARATSVTQIMGNLPEPRVTPARAFAHCGIDYAGPISVLAISGRGQKAHKAYIAVFVCLCTRAIHLELVSDYSTKKFLAAFTRFASRRGTPTTVMSDNGTTFQGADRELRGAFRTLRQDPELQAHMENLEISWKFIPPSAPHHGGIWEAGVKSTKHHLRRVIGDKTLSIEEMFTFLKEVEACLNSRPIWPLTDDPSDTLALTPGHFLIGAPIVGIPEPSVIDKSEQYLCRWQRVRRMTEVFWRSWSTEYLHTLQQRHKWRTPQNDLKVNDIVVLRNPLLPPTKWALARVILVHPGRDGRVRVVTVKTDRLTRDRLPSYVNCL